MKEYKKVYPKYISDTIVGYQNSIAAPRMIYKDEELKVHHKYINDEFYKVFKVEDIFYTHDGEKANYTIKFITSGRYATISSPLPKNTYEICLLKEDKDFLSNDIINDYNYYNGYTIKRWFHYNIRYHYNKYEIFMPYVMYDGENTINDNKYYTIQGLYDTSKRIYTSIRFIMNKNR